MDTESKYLLQREYDEEYAVEDTRRAYCHDRDRVIHSRAFRRLMHKTQIFNANKGDHFRNRLTHTLEVAQIAKSIGRNLNLDEDLIEAIALAHDLGHTPFGHVGERTLSYIMRDGLEISQKNDITIKGSKYSFKHNFQSVRVVEYLENYCDEHPGINLTLAVREGILKHTRLTTKDQHGNSYEVEYEPNSLNLNDFRLDLNHSITLEGQVVAIADEIAQLTHDIDDGIIGKIISFSKFCECELVQDFIESLGESFKDVGSFSFTKQSQFLHKFVGFLISDVTKNSFEEIEKYHKKYGKPTFVSKYSVYDKKLVGFSKGIELKASELAFMRDSWILSSKEISQNDSKAEYFITQLFKAYYRHPKELPDYILARYYDCKDIQKLDRKKVDDKQLQNDPKFIRYICDHIAGMSDQYAEREYINLYLPKYN